MAELFGDFNRGTLLLLTGFGRWQIVALGTLALLVCVLTALDVRDLPRVRRWTLVGLRALSLSVALLLVLEPALELEHVTVVPNHVAVLIDTSESQSLATASGETRFERARAALDRLRPMLEQPAEEHVFEVIDVTDEALGTTLDALGEMDAPDGAASHLLEAVRSVADRYGANDLGGFVIVSDGIDNGELGSRVARGQPLDAETVAFLTGLGVPVHGVATAAAGEIRDIAVARVHHDEFAFVRNAVSVVAELRVLGTTESNITVTLSRDGQPLQTRDVVIEPGRALYPVEFEFVPELLGKEVYTVETPVLADEALAENNREYFVLNVIRDKIRVLQVVGRPTWDVRFMRQLLQNNPNVDLICFFILRTQDDVHRGGDRELSLIPFPTDELFDEQLGSFDLVVFQNFDYAPYEMNRYLARIRDYVLGGGGFLMVGGDLSFASGDYALTEVADVLPVDLPPGDDAEAAIDPRPFRPVLTDAGQRHPITRLAFDAADNRALWESLPAMRGTNVVLGPREGTVVLATHPDRRAGDGQMPVVAVSEQGEGRSMAVTYDSSWRWAFENVNRGDASQPYTAFWNSAFRWLIRDPALNLVDVVLPRDVAEPGDSVEGTVRVLEPDYSPSADRPVTITVVRKELGALDKGEPETVLQEVVRTDDRGEVRLELGPGEAGAYEVSATVEDTAGQSLRDAEVFLRVRRSRELRDIEPRPELLEALAEATDGRFVSSTQRVSTLPFREARVEEVSRRRVVHLWSNPYVLALLVLVLGTEWTLRRRWGRL